MTQQNPQRQQGDDDSQQADEQQSATIDHPLPESNLLGASRDEVTRSRSRRLRGPPARK